MRMPTALLASLMLVLIAWTGTVHAAEMVGCSVPAQAEMVLHVAGDCDQVPADTDKNFPHHHDGCHGQHVSTPAPEQIAVRPVRASQIYGASRAYAMAAYEIDRTLRPPRA